MRVWNALGQAPATLDELCARSGASGRAVSDRGDRRSSCAESSNARSPARFVAADGAGPYFGGAPSPRLRSRPVLRAPLRVLRFLDRRAARRAGRRIRSRARQRSSRFDSPAPNAWAVSTRSISAAAHRRGSAREGVARLLDALARRIDARAGRRGHARGESRRRHRRRGRARGATAGVNRLSLGAQSFDDRVLAWMHRTHDAAADRSRGRRRATRRHREPFARPDLRAAGRRRTLLVDAISRARSRSSPTHVSLYGLTIEPHTPLGRWQRARRAGRVTGRAVRGGVLASRTRRSRPRGSTTTRCRTSRGRDAARGTIRRTGRGVPYVGLGPSSHGFDGVERRWNVAAYAEWLRRLAERLRPARRPRSS